MVRLKLIINLVFGFHSRGQCTSNCVGKKFAMSKENQDDLVT